VQRFISEDPIGLLAGVNFFAYAQNGPLNFADPTGFINRGEVGTGAAIAVAGLGNLVLGGGLVFVGCLMSEVGPLALMEGLHVFGMGIGFLSIGGHGIYYGVGLAADGLRALDPPDAVTCAAPCKKK